MRTPRLSELALALSLASCAPKPPETTAVQQDTSEAVKRVTETPKTEVDQLIAEMERALKDLQAPPCEATDGPRKAHLKAAIAKAQAYLAQKGRSITIGDLNCDPNTLAVIVGILEAALKEADSIALAQAQ